MRISNLSIGATIAAVPLLSNRAAYDPRDHLILARPQDIEWGTAPLSAPSMRAPERYSRLSTLFDANTDNQSNFPFNFELQELQDQPPPLTDNHSDQHPTGPLTDPQNSHHVQEATAAETIADAAPTTNSDNLQTNNDVINKVRVKLCAYKGRTLKSQGQSFLIFERDNHPPLAIGFAPSNTKAKPWTHGSGQIKNCQEYLLKSNVKYIDLALTDEQALDILAQIQADSHALGQGQVDALNDRTIDLFTDELPSLPQQARRTTGVNRGFRPTFNSTHYLHRILENHSDALPNHARSPKQLWRHLDANGGENHPTPHDLKFPQSMTVSEYIDTHIISGRSRKVPTEMARQSMAIMREIRQDLKETFIDPPYSTLDVDLFNRASGFLNRFTDQLDKLTAVTVEGYEALVGRGDGTFYLPPNQIDIDRRATDNNSPTPPNVEVWLCSYPARGAHREGQAFLSFKTDGEHTFAVGLAPDSGAAGRLDGLVKKRHARVVDASHHIDKKRVKGAKLELNPSQIQQLIGQINADAQRTGSALNIINIGGIQPTEPTDSGVDTRYRSAWASKLSRRTRNNSVDYLHQLMESIGHDLGDLKEAKDPRKLNSMLAHPIHNYAEAYIPQNLTFKEGLKAMHSGLRRGLPNMLSGIEAGVLEIANNIDTLREALTLVDNDHDQFQLRQALNTARTTLNTPQGLREYAANNIHTIDRILSTLSRDFQIISGNTEPELPNPLEGKEPYPEAERHINLGSEAARVLVSHRTEIPRLLRLTMLDRAKLTHTIRDHLAEPIENFNQTVGQGNTSALTLLNSTFRDPSHTVSSAHSLRRNMAQGARESRDLLHNIARNIRPTTYNMMNIPTPEADLTV